LINVNKYNKFVMDFEKNFNNNNYELITCVCIGTDRITGDCFGPIVGSIIKNKQKRNKINNLEVIGTLDENLSYSKIENEIFKKRINYKNRFVIFIDAALGNKSNIGNVLISNSGIEIGKCLGKQQKEIGNITIKAVVGENLKNKEENFRILQNIHLNSVMELASIVANGIIEVVNKKQKNGKNILI